MPRLNHTKTKSGCARCKARKVKCDEGKPTCGACVKHNVLCEYGESARRKAENAQTTPTPGQDRFTSPGSKDPGLEMRLMHHWTAYTCISFSTSVDFFRCQAPLIAMEHRLVLDAMFGLTALHASRQPADQWIGIQGLIVPLRDPLFTARSRRNSSAAHSPYDDATTPNSASDEHSKTYLEIKRNQDMLRIARDYFSIAIESHGKALTSLTRENIEASYLASILVSFHALFTLSEPEHDSTLPTLDPVVWLRLADGTRYLCEVWREFVGDEWMDSAGVFFGRGGLFTEEELFQKEYGRPFDYLLAQDDDHEAADLIDRDAYRKSVAYVAFVYKGISEGTLSSLAACRRLVAMPSRLPKRFTELYDARAPRAMVILAHAFATMKLIADDVPWFRGIAENQIPRLSQGLPGWEEHMEWPMLISQGRTARRNKEADISDVLALG